MPNFFYADFFLYFCEEQFLVEKMNEVIKALKERRSVRKFKADMPKKEDLNQIIEAGLWAASGRGQQSAVANYYRRNQQGVARQTFSGKLQNRRLGQQF